VLFCIPSATFLLRHFLVVDIPLGGFFCKNINVIADGTHNYTSILIREIWSLNFVYKMERSFKKKKIRPDIIHISSYHWITILIVLGCRSLTGILCIFFLKHYFFKYLYTVVCNLSSSRTFTIISYHDRSLSLQDGVVIYIFFK